MFAVARGMGARGDVEDILLEAAQRILEAAPQLKTLDALKPYFARTVRAVIADDYRTSGRLVPADDDAIERQQDHAGQVPSPEELFLATEATERILARVAWALAKLPPRQRLIAELWLQDSDLTFEEIGRKAGMTAHGASACYRRALLTLEVFLSRKEP